MNVLSSSALLACSLFVLTACNPAFGMDAPTSEFGYRDLVASGIAAPNVRYRKPIGGSNRRVGSSKPSKFVVIAQAKLHGKKFYESPFIVTDVRPQTANCGPYDWLFIEGCKAPEDNVRAKLVNVRELSNSFVYVYQLPGHYANPELHMGSSGSCGWSQNRRRPRRKGPGAQPRSAKLISAVPGQLCRHAPFVYKSCSFWRCKWKHCDGSTFLVRIYQLGSSGVETLPMTVPTGSGFDSCSENSIPALFKK